MSNRTKVGILIGHSIAKPLEEAVELAMSAVNDFRNSELAIDLWVDTASRSSLRKLAAEGVHYLLFYTVTALTMESWCSLMETLVGMN